MVVHRRKKCVRMRGSKTHGGGAKKKRRGAGNRGGRGMAGSGKRADQKKTAILKYFGKEYFGKRGFKRPQNIVNAGRKISIINLDEVQNKLNEFVGKGLVKKEGDLFVVDMKKIGVQKILGRGEVRFKMKVKVQAGGRVSKNAIEKIKEAGGFVEGDGI